MKTTLTVLFVAMVLVLAWALGRERREPREQPSLAAPSGVTAEVEETSAETDLAGEAREPGPESRALRTEVPAVPATRTSSSRFDPATAASLEVLVVAEETNAPLPDVELSVYAYEGPPSTAETQQTRITAEWVGGMEGEEVPRTDEQGRASFFFSPDTRILVRISSSVANTGRNLEPF